MTEPLPDTWALRDLPVLRAIAAVYDHTPSTRWQVHELALHADMDQDDATRAIVALTSGGYITAQEEGSLGGGPWYFILGITERGRRAVGLWPSEQEGVDRLLQALEAQIAQTTDPERRTKLERIRDALGSAGRDVTVGLVTAVLTGQLPVTSRPTLSPLPLRRQHRRQVHLRRRIPPQPGPGHRGQPQR